MKAHEKNSNIFVQVAELESEIETLRAELRDKETEMQQEVSEVKKFWRSRLIQEKASHSVETNALREALNTLRRQMSTQTTSWTASSVRNGFVVGNGGDEVRLHGPEQVSGDGDSEKPVATGPDPDFGSKLVCDAWTQLPGMAGNPSEALSSVAMAYQVSTTSGTAEVLLFSLWGMG